ncbi:division plane positioning ATPase MipZ [Bradyrhizobium sp. S69]|uniref:division plane positioning ATPase MipZ n=1 Tax=Bradyrhizobium sp. S69 TaxID=1641856 RepID=UPI00131BF908|nr:division plane positioning ATPase MipZ [Bradyrhizobium sp. S69]
MLVEHAIRARSARVIVVGNEKGGSGKSTVAMHIAIALTKSGQNAATIDLDTRQKSFTRYIENRRAWARQATRKLDIPEHFCFGNLNYPSADEEAAGCKALEDTVDTLADRYGVVVIDTPGQDSYLARHAHSLADILITPLNDSFVDLDVLGSVDPATLSVTGVSHYAQMVEHARGQRRVRDSGTIDWIVLRNRLSTLGSRNKRVVGEALQELSRRLNFRHIDGLAERVIFREFYPRGLTAVDDLDEATLNARPTMSHITARLEMLKLLAAMGLDRAMTSATVDQGRDAA